MKGNKMFWFTADLHLNHLAILGYCNRPFSSIGEMNEELILRWNECVGSEDTIYHVGDFCFGDPKKYLSRLNGRVFLLNGSHDRSSRDYVLKDRIIEIQPLNDEYGNPRTIVLSHYALRSWPKSHYASWHLYGHHHGKLEPYGLSFDVGVDTNNFYPYSLEDVEKRMAKLKPIVDFRIK